MGRLQADDRPLIARCQVAGTGSVGEPGAVIASAGAPVGILGVVSHPPVPDEDGDDRRGGGAQADDLRRRETEEGPVPAAAEGLEKAALDAIPDEVEQADIAGDEQAAARREAAPQQEHHADAEQAQHRLVEEERDEVLSERRRRVGPGRTGVFGHAVLALDGDAPGQVGRRAVQLLVHEVAPAADGLGQQDARGEDVAPPPEREW